MNITLRQLRIFESVARNGSITRAAEELHLTQPAVSMQMKQLAEEVGLPLVEIVGRRLFITEPGQELRIFAQHFASQTQELKIRMEQFRDLKRGVLRLAVVSTASYFLSPLIARMHKRYPGMQINLKVGNRDEVLAALAENRGHIAIIGSPPEDKELVAERFMENPLVVIAAPAHALAREKSISMQRLSEEVLVVREPGSGTRAALERLFRKRNLAYIPGAEFSTNEAIKLAVQSEIGVGIIPRQTVEFELEAGRLRELPVEGFPIVGHWHVVHRRDQRLSAAGQAFRDVLLGRDVPARAARPASQQRAKSR